jgi:hypothetical protein
MRENFSKAQDYMRSLNTKEIGGDVLFFRGETDTLTISRSHIGASVNYVEGNWTELEQDAAVSIYSEYSASNV